MAGILLVEDNELNRDMLSRRLVRHGFSVELAFDGAQGLQKAADVRPSLILLDMSLPEIDGWEVARRLKGSSELRGIPVIALTAHAMPDDREQALASGCDDYDTKPIDFPRLLEKIHSLLKLPEARNTPSVCPIAWPSRNTCSWCSTITGRATVTSSPSCSSISTASS